MDNSSSGYEPEREKDENEALWDSDEAIESLKMERALHTDETNENLTRRLLEEAAPSAAQSIIHMALHSANDNTRLRAATYITDKLLDAEASTTK